MYARLGALVLTTALFCSTIGPAAEADDFVRTNKHDVTLEVKAGYFDYQQYQLAGHDYSVLRGRATIQKIERGSQWVPVFGFGVGTGAENMVVLQTRFDGKERPTVALLLFKSGKEIDKLPFGIAPELGTPFDVELRWTPTGTVKAMLRVGKAADERKLDLGLRPSELRLLVSGGRIEVAPLELGHPKTSK